MKGEVDHMLSCLRSRDDKLCLDAADVIERMRRERLELDRRIHNQRRALRENWEIVEMRRKWMGSETARRMYAALLKRYQELMAKSSPHV